MRQFLLGIALLALAGCGSTPNETQKFGFTAGLSIINQSMDMAGDDAGYFTAFKGSVPYEDVAAKAKTELRSDLGWVLHERPGLAAVEYQRERDGISYRVRISKRVDSRTKETGTLVHVTQRVPEDRM